MLIFQRERTPTGLIMYALYLYFLGLSFRNTAKALDHHMVHVYNWMSLFVFMHNAMIANIKFSI